jgi:hypothetical protein
MGRGFFEGWYFKHRSGGRVFAAIPGRAIERNKQGSAFIQTISSDGARYFPFPLSAFRAAKDGLSIQIGDNRFSEQGMELNLPGISARFRYGEFTRLTGGDVMGPFAHLPLMECRHGIVSLSHAADGYVESGGVRVAFDGGSGYIEKDWGSSFPEKWVWMECHSFEGRPGDSIMLAVARVPFLCARFTGILCLARVNGVQHRIATYRGARILRERADEGKYQIELKQGTYLLRVEVLYSKSAALLAPAMGVMRRAIEEYPSCRVHAALSLGGGMLLNARGEGCGFDCVFFEASGIGDEWTQDRDVVAETVWLKQVASDDDRVRRSGGVASVSGIDDCEIVANVEENV